MVRFNWPVFGTSVVFFKVVLDRAKDAVEGVSVKRKQTRTAALGVLSRSNRQSPAHIVDQGNLAEMIPLLQRPH